MPAFLQLVLIGLVSNLDNLGVGIAYGARRVTVPPLSNLVIAWVAFVFTLGAGHLGQAAIVWLDAGAARFTGAVLLVAVGCWVLVSHWRPRRGQAAAPRGRPPAFVAIWRDPLHADRDASGSISLGESLLLGVALGLNCLTNGFVAGLWGLGAVAAGLSNAAFSYLTLAVGAAAGRRYAASRLGDRAAVAAGCLLILLGLGQLL